jgi:1,4-dihydroxy-2-naphthoate polyprenyltransferase
MSRIKTWIGAFRLRTLPLAASAILLGITVADLLYSASTVIAVLCLTTAICLQILSNLANDYGDFVKGTDNENRLGNTRALQSGAISVGQMRIAIIVLVALSLISGISLLYQATHGEMNLAFVLFFLTGIAAIAAAIKYTVGKKAYGYSGFGDIAVFVFFGPVAVIGTFLLTTGLHFSWETDWVTVIPSVAVGLLSTAVLNTNNIRDIENDRASGKYTIPVKIGLHKARMYHSFLVGLGLLAWTLMVYVFFLHWIQLLVFPAMFLVAKTWRGVLQTEPSPAYNKYLKQLSLGTLLLVLVFMGTAFFARIIMLANLVKALSL